MVPKASAFSAECANDLVSRGFLRVGESGVLSPTARLPEGDFRQRGESMYMVRCARPRFLEIIRVDRSVDATLIEFRWTYEATAACTGAKVDTINHRLRKVYTAHALIDERAIPPKVIRIGEFLPPFPHAYSALQ